jgi:dinuclear metal center YbgI/SA1388 family protein
MIATVADIIKAMESFAPSWLAEEWDNAGLQIGQTDWPVRNVWVALDPSPDVVRDAGENNVDLLITHHPLIFTPLKSINFATAIGATIQLAVQQQMAIFTAHTNLDNATDGLNDILARRIGLKNLKVLGTAKEVERCKLVVYVPEGYEQKVLDNLFETRAGEIGPYNCCSFRGKGIGTFRPQASATPFTGKIGEISHEGEIRIETVVRKNDLNSVIEQIRKNHPYETMAYDIYPLLTVESGQGIGRLGTLDQPISLVTFAQSIKEKLELDYVNVAGKPDLLVREAAVCSGSGSSLMDDFFSSGAQVYVSGDLRYHDARAAEAAGVGLIDIGHFASEHMIVNVLAQRLKQALSESGADVSVEAYGLEKEPFISL